MPNKLIWGVVAVVLILAGLFAWQFRQSNVKPNMQAGEAVQNSNENSNQNSIASTSTAVPNPVASAVPATFAMPIAAGDRITSWNFKGAYTGNRDLEAKAQANIGRSLGLVGTGTYPDYVLYVDVANQYDLLGDGEHELQYLKKALTLNSKTTGLAWHNAGQLFNRLGAYRTARYALEKAVAAEPIAQYKNALADFITEHPTL